MDIYVTLIFHHSGQIIEDEYVGGEEEVWDFIDVDKLSIPVFGELIREHNELKWDDIYYLVPGMTLKDGLRKINGDRDIHQLFADTKGCEEIDLYVTHPKDYCQVELDNVEQNTLEDSTEEEDQEDYDSCEDSLFKLDREDLQQEKEDVFLDSIAAAEEETICTKTAEKKKLRRTSCRFKPRTQAERAVLVGKRHVEVEQIPIINVEQFAAYDIDEEHSLKGSDEEDDAEDVFPQFNEDTEFGEVKIELGMEFPSIKVFIKAVKDFNIHMGREVKWHLHDTRRAQAKCKGEGCPWEIYCSINTKSKTFQVKKYNYSHTCCRQFSNKQADRAWVANKLIPEVRAYPMLTGQQAYDYMMVHYKVSIPDATIFRAFKVAHAIVEGSEKE